MFTRRVVACVAPLIVTHCSTVHVQHCHILHQLVSVHTPAVLVPALPVLTPNRYHYVMIGNIDFETALPDYAGNTAGAKDACCRW